MNKNRTRYLIYLHILLVLYSLSAVCSKIASKQPFMSFKFCVLYGIVLFLLAFYALCWQQIIKGMIIFGEEITPGKVIGAVFVICGIVFYAINDGGTENETA